MPTSNVVYYRSQAIASALLAVDKCPALTLDPQHPSLQAFERECHGFKLQSVVIVKSIEQLKKLLGEITATTRYTELFVSSHGDILSAGDTTDIFLRSHAIVRRGRKCVPSHEEDTDDVYISDEDPPFPITQEFWDAALEELSQRT